MKLRQLKCPNCKGNIIEKEDGIWMCESCRSIFQDDDGPNEFTYNKNVNVKNYSEKHNYEHVVIEDESDTPKRKNINGWEFLLIVIGLIIVFLWSQMP